MQNVAPILQSIASILWVGFAFSTLIAFRRELAQAMGRFKKGKIFGQELELSEQLSQLATSAIATAKEVAELPPEMSGNSSSEINNEIDAVIRDVLKQAAISPKVALITLQSELERQARYAIATRGLLRDRNGIAIEQALRELGQYGFPPNMLGSLRLFSDVRNKIIHDQAATDDDILGAIDSGITILKAVNALPNEKNVVYHTGVDIFLDEGCIDKIQGAKGLILQTTSPGGAIRSHRIFPTTRTNYVKGKQVAWEWNSGRKWEAAWYRDPDTSEIKYAWGGSMEFVGRHLEDI